MERIRSSSTTTLAGLSLGLRRRFCKWKHCSVSHATANCATFKCKASHLCVTANGFEVWRRYSYWWLSRWAAKFSHRYFFRAWRTFRKICRKKKSCVLCRNFISIYKINRTLHGRLGIRLLSSRAERVSKIKLSAREDKIRIPARPCNIAG